jgi:hypothetical protein
MPVQIYYTMYKSRELTTKKYVPVSRDQTNLLESA